jgi:hypothetical protein
LSDECNGSAFVDECGDCVGGNSGLNPCVQDCAGAWGGSLELDKYCHDQDGDGLGDIDTIEWFCSSNVENGFIEDCMDVDDSIACNSNYMDACGVCDGEGPQVLCSDGSTTCTQNQCPDLVANYFTPAYLEYDLDSLHNPMTFYVASAILDEEDLETNDEIGVFDGDVCVGVGVVDGTIEAPNNLLSIIASAQDGNIPGYVSGNDISYRFWDLTVPEEIIEMEVEYLQGNGEFGQPGDEFYLNLIGKTEVEKPGCMDEFACNHDVDATMDDGSCLPVTCDNGMCVASTS